MSSGEGRSLHWAMLLPVNAPGTESSMLRFVTPAGEDAPMSKTRLRLPRPWHRLASNKPATGRTCSGKNPLNRAAHEIRVVFDLECPLLSVKDTSSDGAGQGRLLTQ